MSQESGFCSKCGAQLQPNTAFCPKCGAAVGQAAAPAGAPLSGIDALAKVPAAQSYWIKRFFAFVVDAIIAGVIIAILVLALVVPAVFTSKTVGVVSIFAGFFAVIVGLFIFLYFIVAEVTRGATIGKQVFHLRVVGPKGGNPTVVESLVRNISKIYRLLLLLDIVVGLATSKKYTQKFSDSLVGTLVVDERATKT